VKKIIAYRQNKDLSIQNLER